MLFDSRTVDGAVTGVTEALARSKRAVVVGPTGSGRGVLLQKLAEKGFKTIEPPHIDEPDATPHLLLQLAAAAGGNALDEAQDDSVPPAERAGQLARKLAFHGSRIAIRLPGTWPGPDAVEDADSAQLLLNRRRVMEALDALCRQDDLPIVLIVLSAKALPRAMDGASTPIRLRTTKVYELTASDLDAFGTYRKHAAALHARYRAARVYLTPIEFRIAVALVALGEQVDADFLELVGGRGAGVRVLETRLVNQLARRPDLAMPVYRAALARRPLPRDELVAYSGITPEHEPLLSECLGYGGSTTTIHERLRAALLQTPELRRAAAASVQSPEAHADLAKLHAQRDGQPSVARSPSAVDWLERVHHIGSAGPAAQTEWQQLDLRCREFFWDRGRSLSLLRQYASSAQVYRACLERFGEEDPYSQHYLGFNLDRAGTDRAGAEAGLRKAVKLEPDNPWWNSRLVTLLIEHTRFRDARREWFDALERVDPDSSRIEQGTWLAENLHRWVVTAWLDAGEVELAREAFDSIPPQVIAESSKLLIVEERLADAEEARQLGESVYPAHTPIDQRWKVPRIVPQRSAEEHPLVAWYPGRVVEGTESGVTLVFADPRSRRVKVRDLPAREWLKAASTRPADAHGFVEIGSYQGGGLLIRPVVESAPSWVRPIDQEFVLRHFRG